MLATGMATKMPTHTQTGSLATSPNRMSSRMAPSAAGPIR